MIGLTVGRGVLWGNTRIFQARVVFGRIRWFFLDNYFFYIPILGPKTCTYMYSMFLLNILWLFCNYPFLSYVAVSNLTAIYILLLHLSSIGQHLQVHSLWGLKCLTSFFPWRFSILLGKWGPPLLFFFWVFVLLFSVQCMCVGFSVHVAQQDFYYFKGYQFGDWYLSNFRFFGLSQGPKVMKNVPLQKVATNKN